MPAGLVYYGMLYFLAKWEREWQQQLEQADTEGMPVRYVRLDGCDAPRMLSYAEVQALRHDLDGQ
jgi:hypothetical protein